MIRLRHPFHILTPSLLPISAAAFAFFVTASLVLILHLNKTSSLILLINHLGFFLSSSIVICWFLMIIIESAQGYHTHMVQKGLRLGFWLFLVSEAMLFFSFFWAYFHYSFNSSTIFAHQWPPEAGMQHIDPFQIPLLNTIILLLSGFTATLAHRSILNTDYDNNKRQKLIFIFSLIATICLGITFLIGQVIEYSSGLNQNWSTNVYWSIFFLLTGFHGFHVIIGTAFLLFNLIRIWFFEYVLFYVFGNKVIKDHIWYTMNLIEKVLGLKNRITKQASLKQANHLNTIRQDFSITSKDHLSFETALYYWHFVDAIWIFLYMIIYIWGS